jgi:hypothetical protein
MSTTMMIPSKEIHSTAREVNAIVVAKEINSDVQECFWKLMK